MYELLNHCISGNIDKVKFILDTHDCLNINFQDSYGCTALIYVCKYNYAKIANLLLGYKGNEIDPNIKDEYGHTALFYACEQNYKKNCRVIASS